MLFKKNYAVLWWPVQGLLWPFWQPEINMMMTMMMMMMMH